MIRQSTYQAQAVRSPSKNSSTRRGRGNKSRRLKKFLLPIDQAAEYEYKELVLNKCELQFLSSATARVNQCKNRFVLAVEICSNNRYEDVLPLESTAVKLQPLCGIMGSDYINANFVIDRTDPRESKKQVYICCQAPLVNTFADFWRMVWEQSKDSFLLCSSMYHLYLP